MGARVAIVVVLLALGLVAGLSHVKAQGDEVVAVVPRDFPPYYRVDGEGRPSGHSIEVMDHLAELAHLRVRYVVRPDWESAMEALRKGEADLIPNLGITAERMVDFDFSSPLETLSLGVFVRSDDNRIHGMDGLAGGKVAVVRGNAAIAWLRNYPQVKQQEFQSQEQALFGLLSGDVDAFIYPTTVTWRMASAIGVDGQIRQAGLPVVEIKRALAVRKGNNSLLQRLDGAVREYTRSEQFGAAYARLHAEPKAFWTAERLLRYGAGLVVMVLGMALVTLLWWHSRRVAMLRKDLAQCRASLAAVERERDRKEE